MSREGSPPFERGMPSFEHLVFCGLAFWMLLRISGILKFIQNAWLYRQAKLSAERLAKYILNDGSDLDLRALIKDHRAMLSDHTVDRILSKINHLANEKRRAAEQSRAQERASKQGTFN